MGFINILGESMPNIQNQLDLLYKILNSLSPLSEESWEVAKPFFSTQVFEKDAYVIRADDSVDTLFFVTSGMARYYYLTENGKEFNKSFQTVGQVLTSVSSLATNNPSPFFIQTLLATECLSIKYHDLQYLGKNYSDWNQLNFRMLEQVLIRKESREADFLQLNASQRYEKFLEEFSEVANLIPNYHIASYLGITEVRLSRIRGTLKLT